LVKHDQDKAELKAEWEKERARQRTMGEQHGEATQILNSPELAGLNQADRANIMDLANEEQAKIEDNAAKLKRFLGIEKSPKRDTVVTRTAFPKHKWDGRSEMYDAFSQQLIVWVEGNPGMAHMINEKFINAFAEANYEFESVQHMIHHKWAMSLTQFETDCMAFSSALRLAAGNTSVVMNAMAEMAGFGDRKGYVAWIKIQRHFEDDATQQPTVNDSENTLVSPSPTIQREYIEESGGLIPRRVNHPKISVVYEVYLSIASVRLFSGRS
jgi:hypothetical protein